jgi:hypothetical protein
LFPLLCTGIIRDRGKPGIAFSESPKRPKTRPPRTAVTPPQSCAKCSFHGTPDQLKTHELQAHSSKQVDCPFCSFVGTKSQLRDHQGSCRSGRALRPVSRRRSAVYQCDACPFTGSFAIVKSHAQFDHNRRQNQSICPVCHARVKSNRLTKHVRKAHGLETVPPTPTAAKRFIVGFHRLNRQQKPVTRKSEMVAREDLRAEQKLDRTRPYAHAYRKNGKFGSHPVHDGFDDESKP